MNEKIKKGVKIRNSFASPFDEIMYLRQAVNLLMSDVDRDLLSDEEKIIYDNFSNYNNKVKKQK